MTKRFHSLALLIAALIAVVLAAASLRPFPPSPPNQGIEERIQEDLRALAREAAKQRLVSTVYYPWYGTPWGPRASWQHWEDFGHNPDFSLSPSRRDIAAADYPSGGPYDSLDPAVMRRHFDSVRAMGIDIVLVSWWGPGTPEDRVLQALLSFSHGYGPTPKLGVFLESLGIQNAGGPAAVKSSLLYALERYSSDPAIFHIGRAPLVYLYTTYRVDQGVWRQTLSEAWGRGLRAFLLGDALFYAQAQWLAGVGVYNAAEFHHKGLNLDRYYGNGATFATAHGAFFYGTVTPGYDDRPTQRPNAFVVPRERGAFYNRTWRASIGTGAPWILITSLNEWHEATEIEASLEYGELYAKLTQDWIRVFKAAGQG